MFTSLARKRLALWSTVACLAAATPGLANAQTAGRALSQRPSTPVGTGNLAIEAGLVMQDGSVRRAARAEFSLVEKSVAALLMDQDPQGLSHFSTPGLPDGDMEVNTYCGLTRSPAFRDMLMQDQPRRVAASMAAQPAIRKYTVMTVQTDFNGKAVFENARAGRYWVFGCYEIGAGSNASSFNWNVPVVVVAGATRSAILDQNNATFK